MKPDTNSPPELLERLRNQKAVVEFRARFMKTIHVWMEAADFLAVTTPTLLKQTLPDTHIIPVTAQFEDDKGRRLTGNLRTSPEVSLKKLLAAGYERIYELGPVFRSHEDFHSPLHTTEFTLLEWYRLHASLSTLAEDLMELLATLATTLLGDTTLSYRGNALSVKVSDWESYTMSEAFLKYGGIELAALHDWAELPVLLQSTMHKRKGTRSPPWKTFSVSEAFDWLLVTEVEPRLPRDRGVLLTHYPNFTASFSRYSETDPRYALRFEAYLGGIEIANAFDELTDPAEQKNRMERSQQDTPVRETIDTEFLSVLPYIEKASGIALGIDRLLMLFLDKPAVQEVRLFPSSKLF